MSASLWLRQLPLHWFLGRAFRLAPVRRRVRPVRGLREIERVGLRPWMRLEAFPSATCRSSSAG
jgi:hypothetical protein